jgi:hypothetical protein
MTVDPNWRLDPRIGLGQLKFGMQPQQVDALASIYGSSKSRMDDRIPDDILQSTLADLGEGLTDEEKQEIIAAYQAAGPSATSQTEIRGEVEYLVLGYEDGRLVEILADTSTKRLAFRDVAVLDENPLAMIRRISEALGETPVIQNEEVAFPKNYIFLFEFVREAPGAAPGAYVEGSRKERSIIWRSGPRVGGVDLSTYKPMTL